MEITVAYGEGKLCLGFHGELDHHAAKEAMMKIGREIDLNLPRECELDFTQLGFMDSSGIAVVLNAHRRMDELGGRCRVTGVPQQAMKVLKAAGIDRIVQTSGAI